MTVTIESNEKYYADVYTDATVTVDCHSRYHMWFLQGLHRWFSNTGDGDCITYNVTKGQLNAFVKEFYSGETVADKMNAVTESMQELVKRHANAVERSNTKTYECRFVLIGQCKNSYAVYEMSDGDERFVGHAYANSSEGAVPKVVTAKVREEFLRVTSVSNPRRNRLFVIVNVNDLHKDTKPTLVYKVQNKVTKEFQGEGWRTSSVGKVWNSRTCKNHFNNSFAKCNNDWEVIEYELVEKRRVEVGDFLAETVRKR